ncbi:MAG: UDP-N-acetylmuramoyl-L-alanyl-D-glutamate--2,6-diaminopimelate ligase, partial [Clostridiales bacterium]|nr:UDP-N-acetylmuramoyl-L-alanyl-D-glutamate--2,6-diaminopimelate ligase [Clostridiales bacterium]
TPGKDCTVLLDYSHTPDSLINILDTIREFCKGRIITVFGCGGDRDPDKRPKMGKAAGERSDYCIVTSDNPRTEDPFKIIDAILPGLKETGCEYTVIENRREAIRHALICAANDDVILLAGKGHEPYQEIGRVRHPFDEKIVVKELAEELFS